MRRKTLLPPPPSEGPLPRLPSPVVRIRLREQMGVSQREAAEQTGVSKNSYGMWERGDRDPRPQHARAYYSQLYGWQQAIEGER